MKTPTTLSRIGTLMIAASVILIIGYLFFHEQIIRFAELYLSSDQQLTLEGRRLLTSTYCLGTIGLLSAGFMLRKAQNASWRNKMKRIFLEEPVSGSNLVQFSPRSVLIISSLMGMFLIISMFLGRRFPSTHSLLYAKDRGLLDLFVSAAMLVSAALIFITIRTLLKKNIITKHYLFLPVFYLVLAAAFVAYAGEETSWGQDFFKWQTPALFSANLENQTNIHNYFNPYFNYIYVALALVLVVVLFSAWLEYNQYWHPYNRVILPHPSLIGLSLLIAFVALTSYLEQELLEEMVATFVLFYSLRIFILFRSGNLSILDSEYALEGKVRLSSR